MRKVLRRLNRKLTELGKVEMLLHTTDYPKWSESITFSNSVSIEFTTMKNGNSMTFRYSGYPYYQEPIKETLSGPVSSKTYKSLLKHDTGLSKFEIDMCIKETLHLLRWKIRGIKVAYNNGFRLPTTITKTEWGSIIKAGFK